MIQIKKYIRSKNDDGINDYIESLENYILNLKASNTNQLIFKLDELNGSIVDDLDKILNGEAIEYETREVEDSEGKIHIITVEKSTLNVLNDSKDSKIFDRVMILFSKLSSLKAVSDHVACMIPEVLEKPKKSDNIKYEKGKNILESIGDQMLAKGDS